MPQPNFMLYGIGCLLAACAAPPTDVAPTPARPLPTPPAPLRVLFLGNSLTYTNDLPAMVAQIAAASGLPDLAYTTLAEPDHSLVEHWDGAQARQLLAVDGWDYVGMQQGPSALPKSRVLLRNYVTRFSSVIRAAGARPLLYAVWPSEQRADDFARVGESYALAAADGDGLLAPAGTAWLAAWQRDPCLKLYSNDGLHPTTAGSHLSRTGTACASLRSARQRIAHPAHPHRCADGPPPGVGRRRSYRRRSYRRADRPATCRDGCGQAQQLGICLRLVRIASARAGRLGCDNHYNRAAPGDSWYNRRLIAVGSRRVVARL